MRHPLDSDGLKHLASENYFSDFDIICWLKQSNMVIINRNKKMISYVKNMLPLKHKWKIQEVLYKTNRITNIITINVFETYLKIDS